MKYSHQFIILVIALITSSNHIFAGADTTVYIENHYGATIKYKAGTKKSTAAEVSVKNLERSFVGKAGTIPALSIRTTGKGSSVLSPFAEITQQVDIIKNSPQDSTMNAIILIKPSKSYENWNISIHWEKAGQEVTVITPEEEELNMIINGSLGVDYAEKARAINDYDYTKSTRGGFINLKDSLLRKIHETLVQTYQPVQKIKGEWIPIGKASEQDLKDTIDTLYRALQKYKVRDNQ